MRAVDLIIDPEQFRIFLKGMMGPDTVSVFAEKTGIHKNDLYLLLQGGKVPSKATLKALGLKIVYVVDRDAKRTPKNK